MADYAISNVPRRVVYAASGVGPYAFTFEILDQTDIAVYKASTLLTLTTDYTVIINANGTGSVTLVLTAGTSNITIVGAKNIQRTTDFTTGGDLFANTLNDELDNQTIFIQQVAETAERGLKAPVVDPTDINMTLPAKASRVGTVLAFNATTGNPEAGPSIGSVTTVAAQSANINTVATNIASVNTAAGNITNINTVAGVSSNVTVVASNIANVNAVGADLLEDTSEINTVAVDIANVNTVGSNIASVNTNANNIASINTNAGNIVAIQNASANANSAASSAASAAASFDSFDDRYLGAKATVPTLDNDGNSLVIGALYFNTVDNAMKVWNGTIWVDAYASLSGGLLANNNLSDVTNVSTSRNNLGLGTIAIQSASNVAITGGSITGITDLAIADGGTGASTVNSALSNFGIVNVSSETVINSSVTIANSFPASYLVNDSATPADYNIFLPAAAPVGAVVYFRINQTATKLFTLYDSGTTMDGYDRRILWAGESCMLLKTSTGWTKVGGQTIPFHGVLKRTSSQTLTTGGWNGVLFTEGAEDNKGLNLAFSSADSAFKAPRSSVYKFTASLPVAGITVGSETYGQFTTGIGQGHAISIQTRETGQSRNTHNISTTIKLSRANIARCQVYTTTGTPILEYVNGVLEIAMAYEEVITW